MRIDECDLIKMRLENLTGILEKQQGNGRDIHKVLNMRHRAHMVLDLLKTDDIRDNLYLAIDMTRGLEKQLVDYLKEKYSLDLR